MKHRIPPSRTIYGTPGTTGGEAMLRQGRCIVTGKPSDPAQPSPRLPAFVPNRVSRTEYWPASNHPISYTAELKLICFSSLKYLNIVEKPDDLKSCDYSMIMTTCKLLSFLVKVNSGNINKSIPIK